MTEKLFLGIFFLQANVIIVDPETRSYLFTGKLELGLDLTAKFPMFIRHHKKMFLLNGIHCSIKTPFCIAGVIGQRRKKCHHNMRHKK